jgi:hypothetical protein
MENNKVVTFILGNGFDMALNLKTSYRDYYEYLKEKKSDNKIIKAIQTEPENWADLEERLGLHTFNDDFTFDQFFKDYIELLKELKIYLKKQESLFVEPEKLNSEHHIFNIIEENLNAHSQKVPADIITQIFNRTRKINFITFNYTNTIDRLVDKFKRTRQSYLEITLPIHIHGNLAGPMALGVNDKTQYNKEHCPEDFQMYFEKFNYTTNNALDDAYLEMKNKIFESNVLICFGTSFGKTDQDYWKLVGEWLQESYSNKILIYDYETNFSQIDVEFALTLNQALNKSKAALIAQLDLTEEQEKRIRNQIHPLYRRNNLLEIIENKEKNITPRAIPVMKA